MFRIKRLILKNSRKMISRINNRKIASEILKGNYDREANLISNESPGLIVAIHGKKSVMVGKEKMSVEEAEIRFPGKVIRLYPGDEKL